MTADLNSLAVRNAERRAKYHEGDVVVVGAGVFGCAIAFALANQGRSVILLERWMQQPDRIVGELLQPGGIAALRKLGLDKCLEGIDAIPCYGYHVMFKDDDVVVPYPRLNSQGGVANKVEDASAVRVDGYVKGGHGRKSGHANGHTNGSARELAKPHANGHGSGKANGHANGHANGQANGHVPTSAGTSVNGQERPQGRSFHHGRFISKLRESCRGHSNITMFETEVTATIRGDHSQEVLGVESRTTDKETGTKKPDYFFGQLTIIADGYASKFRKQYLDRAPIVKSKFYALELIDCPFEPSGFGHVVIGKTSPVLLYQIGTHETRALIDVPEKLPAAAPENGGVRGYISKVVLPTLPEAVRPSVIAALADGRIPKSMPNSWLPPSRQEQHDGVLLLGDAYNMRHPLTGGGMTVAFNDCVILSDLLHPDKVRSLGDRRAVRSAMGTFYWRRKSLTGIINVLAMALYSLFSAEDPQLRSLQAGCFRYFQMGRTAEPCGMLGGLIHRPLVLAQQFVIVAFLSIWLNGVAVCGGITGLWKLPLALVDAVMILYKACMVFVPVMWAEVR